MLAILISLLGICITIFFVIGTHEAAHFITARWLGVKVLRFSIGFGKKLWGWHDKSGTEYVIALIPLGGYVKMLDETEGVVSPREKHLAYNQQPFYKKFLIVLAGPFTNLLCAFLLYWVIFMIGFVTMRPVIGHITPRSIAAESGMKGNQEITHVDHARTRIWTGALFRIILHAGNQDHLKLETTDLVTKKTQDYVLDLSNWHMDKLTPDPLSSLGLIPFDAKGPLPNPFLQTLQFGPIGAASHAWDQVADFTYFNAVLFGKLFTGKLSLQGLGGPITIFESAGQALNYGIVSFASFLAFLSLSIGLINLLPIPGLDGGHLFLQFIEFIIRRPIPENVQIGLYRLGFLFIIFILIQALMNDLMRML